MEGLHFDGQCSPCTGSTKTSTVTGEALKSAGVFFPEVEALSTAGTLVSNSLI